MKKKIMKIFLPLVMVAFFTMLSGNMYSSPCPSGVNQVTSSLWSWNNIHTYTMCGCQAVRGYESSGHCSGNAQQ